MCDNNKILFGCVADDFTGGSDAASFLALGGMRTILVNGIPSSDFSVPAGCEGVVIALKSRTQETAAAIRDSLAAFRWLREQGAKQLYLKYCSTFDSTTQGNIGPVADAVLQELKAPATILCPALPANDRRVRDGILYVKGVPLAESPMRDHPLTPMRKSRISELMAPQSGYESLELHRDILHGSEAALFGRIASFAEGKSHYYLIPDYDTEEDAERIVALFGRLPFLTGGSGILTVLARQITGRAEARNVFTGTPGRAILVAGSCSVATHSQTEWYRRQGKTLLRLTDEGITGGTQTPDTVWAQLQEANAEAPLVYCWDTPEALAKKRDERGKALSAQIEKTLSGAAALAVKHGFTRVIAAGGETSGAVTQALGYRAFWIGQSIAPGVPILIPVENESIRLVLKSGNFGQEDFFGRALQMTGQTGSDAAKGEKS